MTPSAESFDRSRAGQTSLCSFDASIIPTRKRLREWRAFVSDHLAEADLAYPDTVAPNEAFGGRISVDRRDRLSIGRVCSAHQRLDRTLDHIRRANRETLLLKLVSRGLARVEQDGRMSNVGPGQSFIYTSRRPYRIDVPGELTATIIMVDRSILEPTKADRLESFCGRASTAGNPVGNLVFGFWQQLASVSCNIDDRSIGDLICSGFDLVEFELPRSETSGRFRDPDPSLQRAKHFAMANLDNPALSPSHIARAGGLSLRRTQELFQADGTTMRQFIRDLRLMAAYRNLENPAMRRATIASIAALHGFSDQSRFNREFKARFGMAPGVFRRRHHNEA